MTSYLALIPLALLCGTVSAAPDTQPPLHDSFSPGQIWTDNNGVHINAHGGGVLYDRGTYYWYGEHKIEGDAGNYAQVGVHCYSSKDLYNWKDEGIALKVSEDEASPIAKGCILERPKVVYNSKTGKYVMWFHLELKGKGYGAAYAGTAVADKPTGPFTFLRAGRVNAGQWPAGMPQEKRTLTVEGGMPRLTSSSYPEGADPAAFFKRDFPGGQMSRDMTIFVDDDGKAYHIYSSEENGTTHIAQLTDDYTAHNGRFVRAFPGRFMEAPAVFKHEGKYYFIGSGCSGWAPNAARSAVADKIEGPWKELGNPCTGSRADKTFGGQSTYILPVQGKPGTYIFMADIWKPQNAIDGRYMWLPIRFEDGKPKLEWKDRWQLP